MEPEDMSVPIGSGSTRPLRLEADADSTEPVPLDRERDGECGDGDGEQEQGVRVVEDEHGSDDRERDAQVLPSDSADHAVAEEHESEQEE
jgi:hypothetical protein